LGGTSITLRWGIERRLEFIELGPFREDQTNRGDLGKAFGIPVNRASTELNDYLAIGPANRVSDKSVRACVPVARFRLRLDVGRYLSHRCSISDGNMTQRKTWIGQVSAVDTAGAAVPATGAGRPRAMLQAIRKIEAIKFEHQSFFSPTPRWRWIAPLHGFRRLPLTLAGVRLHRPMLQGLSARAHSQGREHPAQRGEYRRRGRPERTRKSLLSGFQVEVLATIAPHE